MSTPSPELDERLQADLVAYLDGELDAEQARRIERLLYSHPGVQEEVRKLEASWDLLDELPQTHVDERFTRTTVELVIDQLSGQLQSQQRSLPRQLRRRWLAWSLLFGLTAFATVVALDSLWFARQRRMLEQVPLLLRLEQYEEVRDVRFLKQMVEQKLVPLVPEPPAEGDSSPRSNQP